jgi:hypothetical protein
MKVTMYSMINEHNSSIPYLHIFNGIKKIKKILDLIYQTSCYRNIIYLIYKDKYLYIYMI